MIHIHEVSFLIKLKLFNNSKLTYKQVFVNNPHFHPSSRIIFHIFLSFLQHHLDLRRFDVGQ